MPEAIFLAPAPAVPLVEAAGVARGRIHPAFDGVALEAAGARVTAVRAAHELHPDAFGGYRFWLDEQGDHRCLSYLVELDGHAVFHAGDSDLVAGDGGRAARARARTSRSSRSTGATRCARRRRIWGNLNHDEAAALAAAAGVPAVVPCHFDGVAGNLGDPAAFLAALRERGPEIAAHVLHPGDRLPLAG